MQKLILFENVVCPVSIYEWMIYLKIIKCIHPISCA